jgi:hypothetical protein
LPGLKVLTDFDFNSLRSIQGETANAFYAPYSTAIDALERTQMGTQHQQADSAAQHFQLATLLLVVIGTIAIVVGVGRGSGCRRV